MHLCRFYNHTQIEASVCQCHEHAKQFNLSFTLNLKVLVWDMLNIQQGWCKKPRNYGGCFLLHIFFHFKLAAIAIYASGNIHVVAPLRWTICDDRFNDVKCTSFALYDSLINLSLKYFKLTNLHLRTTPYGRLFN